MNKLFRFMAALWLLALLFFALASMGAATVTGNITDIGGEAGVSRLTFYPMSAPYFDGTNFVKYSVKVVRTDNAGAWSTTLARGDYRIIMDGTNRVNIAVPAGAGPFDASDLVISALTYPWQTPPALDDVLNVDTTGAVDGQALIWDAAAGKWVPGTVASSGGGAATNAVTSINASTNATQTLVVGSAGTDFTIGSTNGAHTFNLPTASATVRGLLSSANWSSFFAATTNALLKAQNLADIGSLAAARTNLGVMDINVKLPPYSAAGDGSTDDTAAIQAAINAAQSASSRRARVYFPPGTFAVSSSLTVTNSNVELIGDGFTTSIIKGTASGMGRVLYVYNSGARLFDVAVRNLRISGTSGLASPPNGVEFANASECIIEDFYGTECNNAIVIDGCEVMFARRFTLASNAVGIYQTSQVSGGFNYGNVWAEQFNFYHCTNASVRIDGPISKSSYSHGWIEATRKGFELYNRSGTDAEVDNITIHDVQFQNINGGSFEDGGKFINATATAGGNYFVMLNLNVTDCKAVCIGATNAVEFIKGSNTNSNTAFHAVRFQNCMFPDVTTGAIYSDTSSLDGVHSQIWVQGGLPATTGSGDWYLELTPPGLKWRDTAGTLESVISRTGGNDVQITSPTLGGGIGTITRNASGQIYWDIGNDGNDAVLSPNLLTVLGHVIVKTNLTALTGNFTNSLKRASVDVVDVNRTISAGAGLSGGGSLVSDRSLALDILGQTTDAAPDRAADYVITYDASAGGLKKVLLSNLPSAATVTSVDLAVPSWLTVSGNPITSSGTITVAAAGAQVANRVIASPDGTTGAVSLRALVTNDIPSLDAAKIGSGTFAAARLGSGTATANTFLWGDQVFRGVNDLTADATPDGAADYVMTWDASGLAPKKVLLNNLPSSGGGEANTASSLGTGWPLPYDKSGTVIRFNSITNDASLSSSSNANTLTFSRAALTGDVTASAGANSTTIAAGAVTLAKMANIATDSLIGRDTAGTGVPEALTVGGGIEFTGAGGIQRSALTGDVTASAGGGATTIASGAVTLAKMANIATDSLIGRDTAGTGVPEALTVGGGIEFTGSGGIQRSALTGDIAASAGSGTTTLAASIPGTHTWTGSQVYTNASHIFGWKDLAGGTAIDYSAAPRFYKQLTANVTWTTSNEADGAQFRLLTEQNATGGFTQTFPAAWVWTQATNAPSSTAPSISTNAGVFVEFEVERRNGTNYARIIADRDSQILTDVANATATSAQLAGYITDESGTGAFVMSSGNTQTNATMATGFNVSQDVKWSGDISPTQITADQNDYNPTGLSTASALRLSSDAARNITGLQGGADGRWLVVHNVGAQNIVLKDESASSTAGNRFALTADVTLAGDAVALLQYDSTSSRWRMVGGAGGGGSGTVTSVATGGGLTGGTITTTGTLAWDYTATLAGNPAMNSGEVRASTNGFIFEGSTADANETLLTVIDPTADRTISLPNASGTVAVSASGAVSLSATGDITATRVGVYRTLWIDAAAMQATTTNGATASTYTVSGADNFTKDTWSFADAVTNNVQFAMMMPDEWDRSTVKVKFFWTATSGTGNVVWQIAGGAASDGDALGAILGTAQTVTDALGTVNNQHVTAATSAITVAGTPALGDLIVFNVKRDAINASDTFSGTAQLIGVAIQYKEGTTEANIW